MTRSNTRMDALLAAGGGAVLAAVPERFAALVDAGFIEVDGCVVLAALSPGGAPVDLGPVHDLTGYECFANKLHLEDYLPPDARRDLAGLANVGARCARLLADRLAARAGKTTYRVILSVHEATATLRFHTVRAGEAWLRDDLEGYADDALMVVDTRS